MSKACYLTIGNQLLFNRLYYKGINIFAKLFVHKKIIFFNIYLWHKWFLPVFLYISRDGDVECSLAKAHVQIVEQSFQIRFYESPIKASEVFLMAPLI